MFIELILIVLWQGKITEIKYDSFETMEQCLKSPKPMEYFANPVLSWECIPFSKAELPRLR